jgi:GTP-binding protein
MEIKTADFVMSNTKVDACPAPDIPEYAFIGRSNVGKSSLINMILKRKGLAKTSGKPGKTQTINHFIINKNHGPWYIADLPGYGFAKSSKKLKAEWNSFTVDYILKRPNLLYLFVLIDCRHEPQKIDLEFMEYLGTRGVPFIMIFTKVDKLSSSQLGKNLKHYRTEFLKTWEELPPFVPTSAETGFGREDVLRIIGDTNPLFEQIQAKMK